MTSKNTYHFAVENELDVAVLVKLAGLDRKHVRELLDLLATAGSATAPLDSTYTFDELVAARRARELSIADRNRSDDTDVLLRVTEQARRIAADSCTFAPAHRTLRSVLDVMTGGTVIEVTDVEPFVEEYGWCCGMDAEHAPVCMLTERTGPKPWDRTDTPVYHLAGAPTPTFLAGPSFTMRDRAQWANETIGQQLAADGLTLADDGVTVTLNGAVVGHVLRGSEGDVCGASIDADVMAHVYADRAAADTEGEVTEQ